MAVPHFLHDSLLLDGHEVAAVCDALRADGPALATEATAAALDVIGPLAISGGFPVRALPQVSARGAAEDELGCLTVVWRGDEDATGWPAMTLWVVPTPDPEGTRLALFSPRHPGFDLSTGRVDKVWRDRIARAAIRAFLVNLGGALRAAPPKATPTRTVAAYVSV
jgi:hypothetical protein